jgi:hypothetical protein
MMEDVTAQIDKIVSKEMMDRHAPDFDVWRAEAYGLAGIHPGDRIPDGMHVEVYSTMGEVAYTGQITSYVTEGRAYNGACAPYYEITPDGNDLETPMCAPADIVVPR